MDKQEVLLAEVHDAFGLIRVLEVGDGVKNFKAGQRVMGLTGYGAFAEEILVPENQLIPVPDGMNDHTAAAFSMVYGTSYHALKQRANIQPGETLLVLGASGGVGLAAVELGKAMGAKVIAAASSDDKLQVAKEAGADDPDCSDEGPDGHDEDRCSRRQALVTQVRQEVDVDAGDHEHAHREA